MYTYASSPKSQRVYMALPYMLFQGSPPGSRRFQTKQTKNPLGLVKQICFPPKLKIWPLVTVTVTVSTEKKVLGDKNHHASLFLPQRFWGAKTWFSWCLPVIRSASKWNMNSVLLRARSRSRSQYVYFSSFKALAMKKDANSVYSKKTPFVFIQKKRSVFIQKLSIFSNQIRKSTPLTIFATLSKGK